MFVPFPWEKSGPDNEGFFTYNYFHQTGPSSITITRSAASLKGSTGHLKAIKTTKLFTVEEAIEMMRKASSVSFQAPFKV